MISDLLHDAIDYIERFQDRFPKDYESIRKEIHVVAKVMDALRTCLDVPPFNHATVEACRSDLLAAIRAIDLSAVKAANDRLQEAIQQLQDAPDVTIKYQETPSPKRRNINEPTISHARRSWTHNQSWL